MDDLNNGFGGTVPSGLAAYLAQLVEEYGALHDGEVATYIPELGRADPDDLGVALMTEEGRLYTAGCWSREVTIQSVSKPFMYGAALSQVGRERMLSRVGVEPTGESFNAIILDQTSNRPFNPMVNAGAIATAAILAEDAKQDSADAMLRLFSRLAGRSLSIDEAVFASERDTGHRNRAIAWLMMNSGMIDADPEQVLDLYFRQCSVSLSCADLASMAAVLARQGLHPVTGARIFAPEVVRDVLSVMTTCGMYDYAGQWLYEVGLPAKSGVSGLIMAVAPGQFGLAVYAPRLDAVGNSVRGIEICRRFARDFGLHLCARPPDSFKAIRRIHTAAEVPSRKQRSEAERTVLAETAKACRVVEVQGPLFFATAEEVVHRVRQAAPEALALILDFRRVTAIDIAARRLLSDLAGRGAGQSGCTLHFTELEETGPGQEFARMLRAEGHGSALLAHAATDDALEHHEDHLLRLAGAEPLGDVLSFSRVEMFRGLGPAEIARLQSVASTLAYDDGARIVRAGETALAFYIVARGTVDITVPTGAGRDKRVGTVGPGQVFGEMAMLDGGVRSANAVAAGKVQCHLIPIAALQDIAEEMPQIMTTVLANLTRRLSDRLRQANEQIATYR